MIMTGVVASGANFSIDYFHNPIVSPRVVVVTFSSSGNRELEGLGFGGKFLLDNKFDVIAVKNDSDDWFQSVPDETFDLINRIVDLKGYSTVAAYGASMGGYAAIQFSKRLRCNVVLALSPQYSIEDDFDTRWEKFSRSIRWKYKISRESIQEGCEYVVLYDSYDLDRVHVDLIRDIVPAEKFLGVALPFAGHPVSKYLLESNIIKSVALNVFVGNGLGRVDFRGVRKTSKSYLRNLSQHLYKKNKLSAALFVIDSAIGMDGRVASFFVHKSAVLESMGRVSESIGALEEAISLEPNPLSYLRISKLLVGEKNYQRAITYIEAGIGLFSDMAVLHRQKSEILVCLSDLGLALYSAKIACLLDCKNPFYKIHLSALYSKLGRCDEALNEIEEGLLTSPGLSVLYKKKIEILNRLGDFEGVEAVSNSPEYLASLGTV